MIVITSTNLTIKLKLSRRVVNDIVTLTLTEEEQQRHIYQLWSHDHISSHSIQYSGLGDSFIIQDRQKDLFWLCSCSSITSEEFRHSHFKVSTLLFFVFFCLMHHWDSSSFRASVTNDGLFHVFLCNFSLTLMPIYEVIMTAEDIISVWANQS